MEERTLFAEVRLDGFPYLDASLVVGSYVADYLLQHQTFAVTELHMAATWLEGIHHDVGNHEPLVLLHVSRGTIEVIAFSQLLIDSLDGSRSALLFYLQSYLWCLVFREQQLCEINIAVGTFQVLQFEAYYLYLLHQFVVVGIESIEYIHRVVMLLVGSRVVQGEERIEGFECRLCSGTSHLLRFIQNDDRVVGSKNGNRLSGTELITFGVDDACRLVLGSLLHGVEGLGIDDHHADVVALREGVDVVEAAAVVDEVASLLAVLLHEVIYRNVEAFLHSLSDSDAWNHHDKLGPAILFVQFEHCLDIDVCLSRTGFHLHIELAGTEFLTEFFILMDVVLGLNLSDVVKKSHFIHGKAVVLIAQTIARIIAIGKDICLNEFDVMLPAVHHIQFSLIHPVFQVGLVGLPLEDVDDALHGIGLILLYLKLQFHRILVTVSGEYVLKICSKLVAVESSFMLVSRSTA